MQNPDDDVAAPPPPQEDSNPATLEAADGVGRVRAGVLGAAVLPPLVVIEGGKSGGAESAPKNARGSMPGGGGGGVAAGDDPETLEGSCPLVPLGQVDGEFHFLDIVGQRRVLKARALVSRGDLASLFLGRTDWLLRWFPQIVTRKTKDANNNDVETQHISGFSVTAAGLKLMELCGAAGLYGGHVVMRGPGVWAGDDGAPVVHSGDAVLMGGEWRASGFRLHDRVWMAAPRRPRPAAPAGPEVGQQLQREIADLWQFRLAGSEIVAVGLMAVGYYGTAARWRPNGYLIGGTGSGKSMLLQALRACVPGSEFSTDTTKAGIEASINGKPTPVYIDEAGDRQGLGAQMLLDVVLSASGGDGTRGLRGGADGGSRSFQAACSVIMAAVSPPQMGPQHRDRFTVLHLVKPGTGADNRGAMEELTRWAADVAPSLWGRAIAGWGRFEAARIAFREALARSQCAPREMDQIGAILAAWWVVTAEGEPDAAAASDGVAAVAEFIRGAEDVAADDGPRRVVQFLASTTVQRDRSTDIEQIGVLVEKAWSARDPTVREGPQRLLERFGIRIVQGDDAKTSNGKPVPRGMLGDGMWFAKSAETLRQLFRGGPYEGDRWAYELARHPTAVESKKTVRVGGVTGAAIWLSREDWAPPGAEDDPIPQD
jgi:hypothetical protein